MFRMSSLSAAVVVSVVSVLCSSLVRGQTVEPPAIEWEKTFGGASGDGGTSVLQTVGGGYVVAGWTYSFRRRDLDVYLIKINAIGDVEWQKYFGEIGWHQTATSIAGSADGGYVIAGVGSSIDQPLNRLYLARTDALGSLVWEYTFGGARVFFGASVRQSSDGGFIAVSGISDGGTGYDVYLLKVDLSGSRVWERRFGHTVLDYGYAVDLTSDGGYLIAGKSYLPLTGGSSVYLVKTNAMGNLVWERTFGGEIGRAIQRTTDGGFVVAGTSAGNNSLDFYLLNISQDGSLRWQRTFGGMDFSHAWSIQQTADGGFALGGYRSRYGGPADPYLVKTDSRGNLLWERLIVGQGGYTYAAQETTDGGYVLVGGTDPGAGQSSGEDVYVVKLAPPGVNPTFPPRGPERFVVALSEPTVAVMSWHDISANETSFVIQRQVNGGSWFVLVEVPSNTMFYSDARLPSGTVCYRVLAANAAAQSTPTDPACVVVVGPQPPAFPHRLTVAAGSNQTARMQWTDASDDETIFVIERRISNFCDWQPLVELPANTTTYTDARLPWSDQITYRVAAKNAGGTSAWVESATISHPAISRWQLKIYRPGPDAWFDLRPCSPFFDARYGTAVITHGWQRRLEDDQLNTWILETARLISRRLNHDVNVLVWEWQREAYGSAAQASSRIGGEAEKLYALLTELFRGYSRSVHMMGHSMGSHLVAVSAKWLGERNPKVLGVSPPAQVTLWDTPDRDIGNGNLDFNVTRLRSMEVYVDSYAGATNVGTHYVNVWVNVPCIPLPPNFCHEVDVWYRKTLGPNGDPVLRHQATCRSDVLLGTVGFGLSILATDTAHPDRNRPQPANCQNFGTLQFSKLSGCSVISGVEVFGLDNSRDCIGAVAPTASALHDVSGGDFRQTEGYELNFGFVNSTEMFFGLERRDGGGGGGQVEGLAVRYRLPVTISPEWDYLSFEYAFTRALAPTTLSISLQVGEAAHPLLEISSTVATGSDFRNSGIRDIRQLQGQAATLVFELQSSEPGMVLTLRNLTFWRDPWHDNQAPVANAGADQEVNANADGATVTFDGTASYDLDGDQLTYWWMLAGELLAISVQPMVELPAGRHEIQLVVRDLADQVGTDTVLVVINAQFLRGDSNGDGMIDISDAINTLGYLFTGGGKVTCLDAADANDSGALDISDVIYTLGFLFTGANPPPPSPYPAAGFDPTADGLGCIQN